MCEESIVNIREKFGDKCAEIASKIIDEEGAISSYNQDIFEQRVLWRHAVNEIDRKRPSLVIEVPDVKTISFD